MPLLWNRCLDRTKVTNVTHYFENQGRLETLTDTSKMSIKFLGSRCQDEKTQLIPANLVVSPRELQILQGKACKVCDHDHIARPNASLHVATERLRMHDMQNASGCKYSQGTPW